jgi:CheY-like chemotaxis protein
VHALVIEDQFLVATLIEDVLRDLGFTSFDTVDTEPAAILASEQRRPDLITADEQLTEGSGVKAVRAICEERAIPVVFITDYRAEVRRRVPDAVILDKPFGERTLKEAVAQAIVLVERLAERVA